MMKRLLALVLVLGTAPLIWAGSTKGDTTKKSLTINDPVVVGNTTLKPGDYKMEWQGTGSNVQVSILQGRKTIATAPATIEQKDNAHNGILELKTQADGSQELAQVEFKHETVTFDQNAGFSR